MSTDTSSPGHDAQTVLDRLTDGVLSLDAEWRICYTNATAAALLGHDPETLRGSVLWTAVPELADSDLETAIRAAADESEPTTTKGRLAATDTHVSIRVHPDADGLTLTLHPDPGAEARTDEEGAREAGAATDDLPDPVGAVDGVVVPAEEMSELREREAKLERDRSRLGAELEGVLQRVSDAFFALDDEWVFTYVNEQAADLIGHTTDELDGEVIWDVYPEAVGTTFESAYRQAMTEQETVSFVEYYPPLDTWFEVNAYPSETGLSVYFDDVTDRKERERDLELYETIVETVEDGIYALDSDGRFLLVNEGFCELTGFDREELLGAPAETVHDETISERAETMAGDIAAGEENTGVIELDLERHDGSTVRCESRLRPFPTEDGRGRCGVVRDISERRERERDLELYETIVETVEDGIYALDEDGYFVFVNQGFCELTDYDSEELLGEHVTIVKDESVVEQAASLADAIADGEETSMALDLELHRADGDTVQCETRLRPFSTADGRGRCGVVRDITERRARERALERYRTVVETMDDGVYVVDDGVFTMVNDAYAEMVGHPPEELVGAHVSKVVSQEVVERGREAGAELQQDGVTTRAVEASIERPDGSVVEAEARFVLIGSDGGERLGVVRDVTERKERERALERALGQQRLIADLEREALEGVDVDALLREATDSVAEMLDVDYCEVFELTDDGEALRLRAGAGWPEDRLGTATVGTDPDSWLGHTLRASEPVVVSDLAEEGRFDTPALFESGNVASGVSFAIGLPTDPWGVLAIHDTAAREFDPQDVSFLQNVSYALETAIDRWEYERELKRYEVFTEESTDVNAILDPDGTIQYVTPSVETTLGYRPADVEGNRIQEFLHPEDRQAIEDELASLVGTPASTTQVEVRLQHRNGEMRVVEATGRNLLEDPHIEGIVTYTRDVTERKQRERALREQRDQLSALEQLNAVVREVNTALVESSSRDELERRVCERLVAADPYLFAWVAELDTTASEFVPRTSAGGHDDYLEGISVPYAEGDDCGPTCRAHRTGEIQIAHTRTDSGFESWRDDALAHGFLAIASIPIVHGDRQYGVLNVYAGRENAFDDQEGEVISNLGETLGHAISSLERKAALMTDTVTELELSVPGLGSLVDDTPGDADRTVTVERTLDTGDGVYVVYVSTNGISEADVRGLFGQAEDRLLGIRRLDDGEDGDRAGAYEIRVNDPRVLSTVQAYGGSLREMTVRGNDLALLFELPLEENVRPFVDRVAETYPGASLVRQKQVQRETRSRAEYVSQVVDLLTDKQYQTLETAYFAGYYEWPRRSSASEVGEALSVSDATISQHFRSGHRKLCSVLFDR